MKLICEYESLELTMVEYTSQYFKTFCADKGIAHQLTNPYTPEQNGVSETLNSPAVIDQKKLELFKLVIPA